jgi:hypothetical protein
MPALAPDYRYIVAHATELPGFWRLTMTCDGHEVDRHLFPPGGQARAIDTGRRWRADMIWGADRARRGACPEPEHAPIRRRDP